MVDNVTADDWTPAAWSYSAVMDMQSRLDPVRMTRYADDWDRAIDRIAEVLVELNQQVGAHVDRSWRGQGADASVQSLSRYVDSSLAGLAACRSVAVQLSELSAAAGDLRAASGGFATDALDAALAEIRQRYSRPAVAAGNAVDDIPEPPELFSGSGRRPANPSPVVGSQPEQPPSAPLASSPAPSVPPLPGSPSATQPVSFVPAADPSAPWHAPTSSLHAPTTQWPTPTHSSAAPEHIPLSLDSPPTTLGPPASAPVSGTSPQLPGVTPKTSPPPVAPYFPGMYPGHMGTDGGGERRVPSYLVSAGNTSELIGELPLVAPPVIGE